MDIGSENIFCDDLQVFFTGDQTSVQYAASTRNQRIETYWSRLKKFRLSWWISLFKDMEMKRLYKSDLDSHVEVLIYTFLPIIQREFNEFSRTWNSRHVRQSASAPGGKPDILFSTPESVGFCKQRVEVERTDIAIAEHTIDIDTCLIWKNKDLYELLRYYCEIHSLKEPTCFEDGLDCYVKILS